MRQLLEGNKIEHNRILYTVQYSAEASLKRLYVENVLNMEVQIVQAFANISNYINNSRVSWEVV